MPVSALVCVTSDLNVVSEREDERRIEFIANGLPLGGGVQLAVDTTFVSPLTATGAPRRARGCTTGAVLRLARQAKERTHPELCRSARSRLTVLALEVGGRWSAEGLVRQLARYRARAAPATARSAATSACVLRWSALVSFAATRASCAILLALPLVNTGNVDGDIPLLSDVLADCLAPPPLASRVP